MIDNVAVVRASSACPGWRDAPSEPVTDTDSCDYDLVADDDFVLGAVPGFPGAHVGVGWRGTGYKFAPWVGRVLSELALQPGTVYDIARFDPGPLRPRRIRMMPAIVANPAAATR